MAGAWLTYALGCASATQLRPEDRAALDRRLTGKESARYLKLSFYLTPFFGDGTKKLLTAVPPEEVRLIDTMKGEPINPGPIEKILPAGTRARITRVEFPTAGVVTGRVLYTPRTLTWIYLDVEGEPRQMPIIVPLRSESKNPDDLLTELERYLSATDPEPLFQSWPDYVREAVKKKVSTQDMPADALEMAWGPPERKRIEYTPEGARRETWTYPGGKRSAVLVNGRVASTEPAVR